MSRIPESPINLPNPISDGGAKLEGRVLRWPGTSSDGRTGSPLLTEANTIIDGLGGGEGLFPTGLSGVNILRSSGQKMPMRQLYKPSLCLVLQGAKEILFGDDKLDYGVMECLVMSMEMPASGRIVKASEDAPYVGITIDLDVPMLRDVLDLLDTPPVIVDEPGPCVFVGKIDDTLAEIVFRLLRLSRTPKAIPVLYASVMREIYYWLLSGPYGGLFYKMTSPECSTERVAKAVRMLHLSYAETLRVEQLAEAAGMSTSSFHQHFKALTSMTPLQFQKQLRLLEARRLMVVTDASVAEAAFKVGYASASQFSREYSRTFGVAPKRDAINLQRAYSAYTNRMVPSP